jgi:hypothetical protein
MKAAISTLLPKRDICQVNKKKRIGREFKMMKELGGYDMKGVMLDLGSDMNIFLNKYW